MAGKTRATIEDLYHVPGKAEIVNGEIVEMAATGAWPGYAGDAIFASLWNHSRGTRHGRAVGDNKAFRLSFRTANRSAPTPRFTSAPIRE